MVRATRPKEATATALALLVLMLTPLIDPVAILAIAVVGIALYVIIFWKVLTARELKYGALAFIIAAACAAIVAAFVR